jgi:hypothetical protein
MVVGNSAYARAPLLNPSNDAKAVAAALRDQGFSVIELCDGTKAQMESALAQVSDTLRGRNGVGLLYYAGHGLQLDWRNYLLPVDGDPATAADVPKQAIDLQLVMDSLKRAATRINIIVLDACRDNPFERSATGRGLAPLDAPHGSFVAYSTAPGNVASDGDPKQGHGLYTRYFLKEIREPGATIESVFKRVRLQVRRESASRQVPWESTSLEEDFYFASAQPVAVPSAADRDDAFKREKADWDRIKDSTVANDYYDFLQRWPNGSLVLLAQDRLDRIQRAAVQTQAGKTSWTQQPLDKLVRDGDRFHLTYRDGSGRVTGTGVQEVRRVSDEEYELRSTGAARHTRLTRSGFALQDGFGSYDPPYPSAPIGDLSVGKRWSARSIKTRPDGKRVDVEHVSRIAGFETITIRAGTFDTFRIETTMFEAGTQPTDYKFWIAADVPIPIKYVIELGSGSERRAIHREVTSIERKRP